MDIGRYSSGLWTHPRKTSSKNRLARETSPYLQQHAANPVRLVSLGRGSARARARQRQAGPAVDRLFGLPLVSRHGARIVRGSGDRGAHERAVREHQGRSRRAARHRQDLPVRAPGAHAARRRLAADDVPHARRPEAFLRRHVFPGQGALRHAGVHHAAAARGRVLPRAARRTARAERHAHGCLRRSHAARRSMATSRSLRRRSTARASNSNATFDKRYGGFGDAPKFPHPGLHRPAHASLALAPPSTQRPICMRSTWRRSRSRAWPKAACTTSWAAASRVTRSISSG